MHAARKLIPTIAKTLFVGLCAMSIFCPLADSVCAQESIPVSISLSPSQADSSVDSLSELSETPDYSAWTQKESAESRHQSPTAALFKSMLVPGLGQLGNRKYLKAGIVIALEGTLILRWRHFRNRTVDARDYFEAQALGSTERSLGFAEFEAVRNDRNLFAWLAGTSIFLSMIDAFVDAHLSGFPDQNSQSESAEGSSISLRVAPLMPDSGEMQPTLLLSYQF